MPAPNFEIEIKDKGIQDLLSRIERRVNRLKPAMGLIGEIALGSIQENFEKGGRPTWQPLSQTTINLRKKINKWPGRILVRGGVAGGLMGGITYRPSDEDVRLATNKPYATTQHFGAKKGSFGTVAATVKAHMRKISQAFGRPIEPRDVKVKAHTRKMTLPWGDIPARPFMVIQDEDWEEIKDTLVDFLLGKEND
jgi:phage gpG-like protein